MEWRLYEIRLSFCSADFRKLLANEIEYAGVAELADARDLGSRAARCAGSIPVTRTNEGAVKKE